MRNISYEKNLTRAYVQRRRDKKLEPTADQIWLTDAEHEAIFQACDKPVRRRA